MQAVRPSLARDIRGATIVEFALIAPILISLLVGGLNIGVYLFAKNSVDNAVEAAAREAAIYPTPSDSALQDVFDDALLKQEAGITVELDVAEGTTAGGIKYLTLSTDYDVPVEIIFGKAGAIPVESERRVYVQD